METASREALMGRWRRRTASGCADAYPEELEFGERGVYAGRSDGTHPLWDAGSYTVEGESGVRISTANDAQIVYGFRVAGDTLAFTAPDGCRFEYQRQP